MSTHKSSTPVIVAVVAAAIGVLLLGAVALGLGGTSVSVSGGAGPATAQLPDDGSRGPFVISVHQTSSEFSLLGIRVHDARFAAQVGVVPPAGCTLQTGSRIDPDGPCRGIAVVGDVSGSGTLPGGEAFVVIAIPTSGDCYRAVKPGDSWPPPHAACGG